METSKSPIDLRTLFGHAYRIAHEAAACHDRGGRKDPWLLIIPCRKGHIYPQSDQLLALWWESTARLDRHCAALTLYLDGENEKVYLFRPEAFEEVARIAGPRRRRRLNATQRLQAIQRLRSTQFR